MTRKLPENEEICKEMHKSKAQTRIPKARAHDMEKQ